MGETALATALQGDLDCRIANTEQQAQQQVVATNFAADVEGLRIRGAQIELIGNTISILGNMLQLSAGVGAFGSREASFLPGQAVADLVAATTVQPQIQ